MLEIVLQKTRDGGFVPDAALCAADVARGQPAPWMVFRLMEALNAHPTQTVVKIGDAIADIETSLDAGAWTVGVTKTGNLVGLPQRELEALPSTETETEVSEATRRFREAGAHYVIDSFAGLPPVIAEIDKKLEQATQVPVAWAEDTV